MPAPQTLQPVHVTRSAHAPPCSAEVPASRRLGRPRERGHRRGERSCGPDGGTWMQLASVPFGLSSLYVYQ